MRLHENVQQTWPGARFGVLVLRGFAPQPGAGEAFARRAEAELEALRARHRDYDRKRFCRGEGGRPKKIFQMAGNVRAFSLFRRILSEGTNERKRNPKRRAVWRPESRCTGENGGAVGAGKFFAGQLPTKTQKGLIFEAKMSRMEAAANLLAQSVCIGGTECKFCPERGIMPEETTSASCMFEEDKQNIKNKNTLRSEPKPMKGKYWRSC